MRHAIKPPLCVDCLEDDPAKFLVRSDNTGRLIRNRCRKCHGLWDLERKAERKAKESECAENEQPKDHRGIIRSSKYWLEL